MRIKNAIGRIFLAAVAVSICVLFVLGRVYAAMAIGSWAEHADLLNIILAFLFVSLVGIVVWQIKKIDNNQTTLFKRLDELSKDFYTLEGEHKAIKGRCRSDGH